MFEYSLENEARNFLIENKPILRRYFGVSYYEFQLNKYFMSHLIRSMVRKCSFFSRSTVETMSEEKYKVIHKLFSFIKVKDIPDDTKRLFQERETELFIKESNTRLRYYKEINLKKGLISTMFKIVPNIIANELTNIQRSNEYDFNTINNEKKYKEILEMFEDHFITILFLNEFRLIQPKGYTIFPFSFFRDIVNKETEKYQKNKENIIKCKILANRLPMDICKYMIYPYLK